MTGIDWLIKNKEWVFSGIGVSLIALIFRFLVKRRELSQSQKGGSNSVNIQAGRDIHLKKSK